MRVAVAGGTGLVGRHVTEQLQQAGHVPVVLARSVGVDLMTGVGLDDALHRVQAVIDVSDRKTQRATTSRSFFTTTSGHLLAAGRRAGVRHHVVLSIVGVDRVGLGYYQGKLAQEQAVLADEAGGVGSVLRATQFHEFAGQILDRTRGPVAVVPRMRTQPVAVREVAAALVELACAAPVGRAADLGGPEPYDLPVLARRVLARRGQRRFVLPVRLPGAAGRQAAHGGLLPDGSARLGRQSFEQWLTGPDGPGSTAGAGGR